MYIKWYKNQKKIKKNLDGMNQACNHISKGGYAPIK